MSKPYLITSHQKNKCCHWISFFIQLSQTLKDWVVKTYGLTQNCKESKTNLHLLISNLRLLFKVTKNCSEASTVMTNTTLLPPKNKVKEVKVDDKKLEAVPEFSYLGDNMLSSGGGCGLAAITYCKCASGKFCQLPPLLTSRNLPLLIPRSGVFNMCEECDAACSIDFRGSDNGYTGLPLAYNDLAMIHLDL